MNELTPDVLQIMEDLQRMQTKPQNDAGETGRDSCGYAFEPFDAFSTKPLEFVETAMRLHIEALETFSMLRTLNRHSPLYYRLSGQFEKLLRQLGSCCITKAVLEKQENEPFELLQDLTIDTLREMTAFNFRKCFTAFMDSRSAGKFNTAAFDLSVRWSALDKRLIATEDKIRNQKSEIRNAALSAPGTQYADTMGARPLMGQSSCSASKKVWTQSTHIGAGQGVGGAHPCEGTDLCRRGLSPLAQPDGSNETDLSTAKVPADAPVYAFSEKGRAFPVLPVAMGTVPEDTNMCRRGLSPLAQADSDNETGLSMVTVPSDTLRCLQVQSPSTQLPKESPQEPAVDDNGNSPHRQPSLREMLLRDALDRGDREAYEIFLQTPEAELEEMFREFLRQEDPPPEEEWEELFEPAVIN